MRGSIVLLLASITTVAVTVAATAPALAAVPGHPSSQDYPPRPGGTPFVVGVPLSPPKSGAGTTPTSISLSRGQIAGATAIARADSFVKRLLAGHGGGSVSVTPWASSTKQVSGAIVRLPFSRSAPVKGQWLALRRKPYVASYPRVVALRAFVDLHQRQVVALVPVTR